MEYLSKTIISGIRPHELEILAGHFISNTDELKKYEQIDILTYEKSEEGQLNRMISFSKRYQDKYMKKKNNELPFVLYEKYSHRDVCLLMNCGKDLSSTIYGMKRIGDNMIFRWDSQMGKGINSSYMKGVSEAKRRHLFVKKSDAESNFYYMGQFDIMDMEEAWKENNKGKKEVITKVRAKMQHPVRDDLLRYLQSKITTEENQ